MKRHHPPGVEKRAALTAELLSREYPAECALLHTSPWELLVATILSAQCTDVRVNLTTPALFARFPTPEALGSAPLSEVESLIHSIGFFRAKARSIVEMSREVVARFGGEVPRTMDELLTLRGVGRKTANVVLGVAYRVPGFPVDTHVTRLTRLLGLTTAHDPVQIERDVCALVPSTEWTGLSLRLILHGRKVCVARRPRCGVCVLNEFCPSAFRGEKSP